MFIVNPDPFLVPAYRMSPFKTDDITINATLPNTDSAATYLNNKFGNSNWQYTYNGREAINLALQSYNLQTTDVVTIMTTSQNFYISSCVTKEIEKFCRWNRELLPETKVILVNHEFGFAYPEMQKLKATRLPIIEDCCTTFFSQDVDQKVGKYGDFSVYSLPKFFPIQIGGILVTNTNTRLGTSILSDNERQYIQNVVSDNLTNEESLLQKRNANYDYAMNAALTFGFTPRFKMEDFQIPYALVLNNNSVIQDLNEFKAFLSQRGIQNSMFYGEDAFFLPSHQNLSFKDIDLIFHTIRYFIEKIENI